MKRPGGATKSQSLTTIILLSCVASLISCFPDPLLITGLPNVKPQIVVSTQIVPDESLVVLLTKTFGALDASEDTPVDELIEQIAVSDATVIITGPHSRDTLVSLGPGLYGGISIPFAAGESYTLYVKSESLGEVKATTLVKPQIQFADIDATLYQMGRDTLAQVAYAVEDPAGKNWYMINVQEVEREDAVENLINPNTFNKLLTDDTFDGTRYTETFRVFPWDYNTGDTIAVSFSNVDKDYYDFLKMRLDNQFNLVAYLGEPVNYPSNVEGGKGFFNLYVPDVRFFVLQ